MPKTSSGLSRIVMTASALSLSGLLLNGCAGTKQAPPKMTMTSQMFVCQTRPDIPETDDSDAELASFMVRLVLAHEDCTAQLGTVRNHLMVNGVIVTDRLALPEAESGAPKTSKGLGLF